MIVEDCKRNIPENTTKQLANKVLPNDNSFSNFGSSAAREITHLLRKQLKTEILGDSMVKGIQGSKMKEAMPH